MNEYERLVKQQTDSYMNDPDSVDKEVSDIQGAIEGVEVRGALAAGVKKSFDKSKSAEDRSVEAHDITQNLLDESFDSSLINENFEQRLDDKINNLQPEWTQFKDETSSQLAETEANKADKIYVERELNSVNEELTRKITKNVGGVEIGDLSQGVKESMTGGSVAVVDVDGVNGRINVVDESITPNKLSGRKVNPNYNLVSNGDYYEDKDVDVSGEIIDGSYLIFKNIKVEKQTEYLILGRTIVTVNQYDSLGGFHGVIASNISSSGGTFEATHDGYVNIVTAVGSRVNFTIAKKAKFVYNPHHIPYKQTDNMLVVEKDNLTKSIIEDMHINYKSLTSDAVNFIELGTNLFNKNSVLMGQLLVQEGTVPNSNYFTSEYIRIGREGKVSINYCRIVQVYDEYGFIIWARDTQDNSSVITVDIPEKCSVRFSGHVNNLDIAQANIGEGILPYEKYSQTLGENVRVSVNQIEGNLNKGNKIRLQREGDLLRIIGTEGEHTIEHGIDLTGSANNTLNLTSVRLDDTIIHAFADDITPIRTVSTVGANHGYTNSVVGELFPENMVSGQLYPSVKNVEQIIDEQNDKIIVTESYDILDHESLINWKNANPTLDYTEHLDDIDSIVKLITRYTFYGFGKCNVDTTLIFLKSSPISNIGFLQSNRLSDSATRYMPNASNAEHDFEEGVDLSTYNSNFNVSASNLARPDEPPLFYTDVGDNVKFSMGYLPEQNVSNADRLQQTDIYWDLRGTGKSYPIALSNKISPIEVGSVFQVSGFRNYNINETELVTFEMIDSGECIYIYIYSLDSHDLINRPLPIQAGKTIEEVINHGVTLLTDKTGVGITFSNTEKANAIFRIRK